MAKKTKDALGILYRDVGEDAEVLEMVGEEMIHSQIARMIHDTRTSAGLTQRQLAEMINTQQSTIARLEDADYEGHSLRMLRKIAVALNQRLEIRMVPDQAA